MTRFVERVHEGDREAVLDAIGRQADELYDRKTADVTCPCGVEVSTAECYRCLYCEVRFCEACARDHFGADSGARPAPEVREELVAVRFAEEEADPSRAHHKRMKGKRQALEWVLREDE